MRRLLAGSLGVLGALLVGCGGSADTPGRANPAAAVPDDAAAYFAVDVRPEGASRARLEAALRRLTGGGDPAVALRRVLDDRLETVHKSYESDVAPWLGRRVGIWADDLGPGGAGAIVAGVRNEDRAREAVKEGARSEQNLAGTTLYRYSSGQYGIVLHGLAIYGDERSVRASVAALRVGALRDAPAYRNAAAALDSDVVALGYLDSAALARAVAGLAPGSASLVEVVLEVLGSGPGIRSPSPCRPIPVSSPSRSGSRPRECREGSSSRTCRMLPSP